MNLRDAFNVVIADLEAGNSPILKGDPGVGKTYFTKRIVAWARKKHAGKRVGVAIQFMATQTQIGTTGLPWKGEMNVTHQGVDHKYTITDPAIPRWYLATDCETGEVRPANLFDVVVLILEEWGQGDADTKRANAELFLNLGTPPFFLPEQSYVIACSNVSSRDGVTKEFDFVIGRQVLRNVEGSVQIWDEDFASKPYTWRGKQWEVTPFTRAWAQQHPEIFFEGKPEKQGPWCNPRSATSADRFVQTMQAANNGVIPVKEASFVDGLAGYIGMPATTSYVGDLEFALNLPTYKEVVADPLNTPVPEKADMMMVMAYQMAGMCQKEDAGEVLQYIQRLRAKDMHITFVSSLLRRDYNMYQAPAVKAFVAKHQTLLSLIAGINQ